MNVMPTENCIAKPPQPDPQVSLGKIVTKVPVVLAEVTLQVNVDAIYYFSRASIRN